MKIGCDPDILRRGIYRESFFDFVQGFWEEVVPEKPVWNWHIPFLCEELQKIAERVFRGLPREYDLIINIPPGTTKSTICSIMFPAWVWTRMATARLICGSYAYALSMDLSRKCRMVVQSDRYQRLFPKIGLREDQNTKGHFATSEGGGRIAVGSGGSITGFHGHFILVDDPIDPNAALSEADLMSTNNWMRETLPTRKVDKEIAPTILIMQRLHQNDPTGEWLERSGGGKDLRLIKLPAEVEDGVLPAELGERYREGLLDCVRLKRTVLNEAKRTLGEYGYAGQFSQSPIPRGGGDFKIEKIIVEPIAPVHFINRVRYWDKACLVGGTLVTTNKGKIPIENVKKGDFVLTRFGWDEVTASWMSKRTNALTSVLFSNGRAVTGTQDHLIFSKNKKHWNHLQQTVKYDIPLTEKEVLECQKNEKKKFGLMVESTPDTRTPRIWRINAIFILINGIKTYANILREHYIEKFGDTITEIFPTAIISTIRTDAGKITTFPILLVGPLENIDKNIPWICRLRLRWQIRNIERNHLKHFRKGYKNQKNMSVKDVVPRFLRKVLRRFIVKDVHGIYQTKEVSKDEGIPVYDLTVKTHHEFFANGFLVHNCTKGGGAYTAGILMGKDRQGRFWILDMKRGQWDATEREQIIRQTAEVDGSAVMVGLEQEPGSGGKESAQYTLRNLAGFRVKADRPVGDKRTRAYPFSDQVNGGNMFLKKGEWNADYLNELLYFPRGKYKDQVDASSGAFSLLTQVKKRAGGL